MRRNRAKDMRPLLDSVNSMPDSGEKELRAAEACLDDRLKALDEERPAP